MWKWVGRIVLVLAVVIGAGLFVIQMDWLGRPEVDGEMSLQPRPAEVVASQAASQAATIASLGAEPANQVLFGDFHVHTIRADLHAHALRL